MHAVSSSLRSMTHMDARNPGDNGTAHFNSYVENVGQRFQRIVPELSLKSFSLVRFLARRCRGGTFGRAMGSIHLQQPTIGCISMRERCLECVS